MNEEKAKNILLTLVSIGKNNELNRKSGGGSYVDWSPGGEITLNDTFTIDELEAIVWWIKNKC